MKRAAKNSSRGRTISGPARFVLSSGLLKKVKHTGKSFEVSDTRLKGFVLRVHASGALSWGVRWGRSRRKSIGPVDKITPAQARQLAERLLGQAALGEEPTLPGEGALTLRDFLRDEYEDWMQTHYSRSGSGQVARLRRCFPELLDLPMTRVSPWHVQKFRTRRLKGGVSARTVNRDVSTLRACLRRAFDWGKIESHPLARIKPIKEDKTGSDRYLSIDEEKRLFEALNAREEEIRADRDRGNAWRLERGYELKPSLRRVTFADHLKPMILVSMHTGVRRGELFRMEWADVDLAEGDLTIHGPTAKSSQTRHIPLNSLVLQDLRSWRLQIPRSALYVFPSKEGRPFNNCKKAWATLLTQAQITGFRWHDLRHHFASRLVQAGVDLNTVRELLGHSDLKMTLRYAHLAPEGRRAAVEKLVNHGDRLRGITKEAK